MKQLISPNPNIPCAPGWCLQYVRQTYGLPAVEPSATAGWHNTKFKHRDTNFPDDVWVPLWFSIDTIPEGHVVLRAPDGRIYSTSTNANTPYIHPNLEHLIWFYGPRVEPQYRLTLRYLGWSEDISNTRVVEEEDVPLTDHEIDKIALKVWSFSNPKLDSRDMRQMVQDISEGDIKMTNKYGTSLTVADQLGHIDKNVNDARDLLISSIGGITTKVELSDEDVDQLAVTLKETLGDSVANSLAERLSS